MSTATRCAISRAAVAVGLLGLIAAAFAAGRHELVLAVTAGLSGAGAIGGAAVYLRSVRVRKQQRQGRSS